MRQVGGRETFGLRGNSMRHLLVFAVGLMVLTSEGAFAGRGAGAYCAKSNGYCCVNHKVVCQPECGCEGGGSGSAEIFGADPCALCAKDPSKFKGACEMCDSDGAFCCEEACEKAPNFYECYTRCTKSPGGLAC